MNTDSVDENIFKKFWQTASMERRKKAERFKHFNDAKNCICAEQLLYYILKKTYGSHNADIGFNCYGKPFLKNHPEFFFNISHSGNWVVLGYGKTELGIDIEKCNRIDISIATNFFSKEEISVLNSFPAEKMNNQLIKLWSLKESYLKFLGTGLSTPLNSFTIDIGNEKAVIKEQNNLKFSCMQYAEDYYLSVCGTKNVSEVSEITPENCAY